MQVVGFGMSEGRGRFPYDATKDDAVLHWPKGGDTKHYDRIQQRAAKIAGPSSALLDTGAVVPSTWHPLGGASTTAACNPSMTIAAVAEQATDRLIAEDIGTAT